MLRANQDKYVIINIWTSEDDPNLPGANVGHVAIETSGGMYMSLWPAPRQERISRDELSKSELKKRDIGQYFESRPPKFMQSYQNDTLTEALEEGCEVIEDISACNERQTAVLYDIQSNEMEITTSQPEDINPHQVFLAVTPCLPNMRIALYTLDRGRIHYEFNQLKSSMEGWRLIGSNILSRALSDSPIENCASLAYRLLQAGKLEKLFSTTEKSSIASETSSVTKPGMLAKYLVRAKIKEQEDNPETCDFSIEGETPLADLKKAYGLEDEEKPRKTFRSAFKM